jgi:hypothetical protein
VQAIDDYLKALIESLAIEERSILWLVTDEGDRWLDETLPIETTHIERPIYRIADIVAALRSDVLSNAAIYESATLERYKSIFDENGIVTKAPVDQDKTEDEYSDWLEDEFGDEELEVNTGIHGSNAAQLTEPSAPQPAPGRLAAALQKIAVERNVERGHLKAILRDFLIALHENQVKAWRDEDWLLEQVYYELGDEAVYHLAGLLVENINQSSAGDFLAEVTALDPRINRYKTTVDRWRIESEYEVKDDG